MTGVRLVTLSHDETACLGSAILAGVGAGVFENVQSAAERIIDVKQAYTPQNVDYSRTYEAYTKLDDLLDTME